MLRKSLPFVIVLILLLGRVPRLLAAAANNMASWVLVREWQLVGRKLELLRCEERLESSAAALYAMAALCWDPSNERALVNAGRVAWLEGDCLKARLNWERALLTMPEDQPTAFWLYWASGAPAGEEGLPAEALAWYACSAGQRAEQAGDDTAAVEWYELSMATAPSQMPVERLMAFYMRDGCEECMLNVLRRLADSTPADVSAHWWAVAEIASLTQDWDRAAAAYQEASALSTAPNDYVYLIRAGSAWRQAGNWAAGSQAYQSAIQRRPDLISPYIGLGHIAGEQGHYEAALYWYRKADSVDPGSAWPEYWQGLLYWQRHDCETAIGFLEEAMEEVFNDPTGDAASRYYLARCLYERGQEHRARVLLQEAINCHPGRPADWIVVLGDWAVRSVDLDRACSLYVEAQERSPDSETARQRIEQYCR